jgi:hypothetical protein
VHFGLRLSHIRTRGSVVAEGEGTWRVLSDNVTPKMRMEVWKCGSVVVLLGGLTPRRRAAVSGRMVVNGHPLFPPPLLHYFQNLSSYLSPFIASNNHNITGYSKRSDEIP